MISCLVTAARLLLQAILCVWYVLPPSQWFAPDAPLSFAAVIVIVFALSITFAWLHNRAWDALLGTLQNKPGFKAMAQTVKRPTSAGAPAAA